ncbi:hypothetical protein L209DRAFT_471788 [Thermothelomyces heterothallicus CBS 203.75]
MEGSNHIYTRHKKCSKGHDTWCGLKLGVYCEVKNTFWFDLVRSRRRTERKCGRLAFPRNILSPARGYALRKRRLGAWQACCMQRHERRHGPGTDAMIALGRPLWAGLPHLTNPPARQILSKTLGAFPVSTSPSASQLHTAPPSVSVFFFFFASPFLPLHTRHPCILGLLFSLRPVLLRFQKHLFAVSFAVVVSHLALLLSAVFFGSLPRPQRLASRPPFR